MKALFPGTFDPITNGHLDIIRRAGQLFTEVIVAVSDHGKKQTLFTLEERCAFIRNASPGVTWLSVVPFTGLAVECAKCHGAGSIIRGLRVTSDFEYEFTMAKFMAEQDNNIQVVYLMASMGLTHISSSAVKEIARLGGPISAYVPPDVAQRVQQEVRT